MCSAVEHVVMQGMWYVLISWFSRLHVVTKTDDGNEVWKYTLVDIFVW